VGQTGILTPPMEVSGSMLDSSMLDSHALHPVDEPIYSAHLRIYHYPCPFDCDLGQQAHSRDP